jgi:starch synthase
MDYSTFGMKEFYKESWFEHYGIVNSMKVGIMFADKVTTVSPNYADEIKMNYYGETLHDELQSKGDDLIGVLNGVDYDVWSPETDNHIHKRYSIKNIDQKEKNKLDILDIAGLRNSELPLIGMVTRLTEHKGIDLVINKIEDLLTKGEINFILLGSGERRFVEFFHYLRHKYPKIVFTEIGYNEQLAHKIIAGSDYFLIPSRFEPCGLTQMYSLKYGTVPIVRSTGGLANTVFEYDVEKKQGNGFVFNSYNAEDMMNAVHRALSLYKAKKHWNKIRRNGMRQNNSFSRSAAKYVDVYESA